MSGGECNSHPGQPVKWDCAACGRRLCTECGAAAWQGSIYCPQCLAKREARLDQEAERERKRRSLGGWLKALLIPFVLLAAALLLYKSCDAVDGFLMRRRYNSELPAAPDFRARDLRGAEVSLASLHGKVVILDFWASWCAPCVKLIPDLKKLHAEHADRGLVILGINTDKTRADLAAALAKYGIAWPQIWDRSGKHSAISKLYGVNEIPTTIILDRRGRIYKRWSSMDSRMDIYVRFLLDQDGASDDLIRVE
ncbi:MAG: TlpA disulfide reductase family protein [Elusimicrobiota bacterium]